MAKQGEKVTRAKGCIACHTADGTKRIGPSYKGRYGAMAELSDGSKVEIDDNYIRNSILNPNAQLLKGYAAGQMPAFKGLVTEEEMTAIIAYIKSLK